MGSGGFEVRVSYYHTVSRLIWPGLDLHKTYIDDEHYNSGQGHAYEKYGVDPDVGAIVIVRPDQCKCSNMSVAQ